MSIGNCSFLTLDVSFHWEEIFFSFSLLPKAYSFFPLFPRSFSLFTHSVGVKEHVPCTPSSVIPPGGNLHTGSRDLLSAGMRKEMPTALSQNCLTSLSRWAGSEKVSYSPWLLVAMSCVVSPSWSVGWA